MFFVFVREGFGTRAILDCFLRLLSNVKKNGNQILSPPLRNGRPRSQLNLSAYNSLGRPHQGVLILEESSRDGSERQCSFLFS